MDKISIRNAPHAKTGLRDMIMHVQKGTGIHFSKFIMAEIGSFVGDSTEIFSECALKVHCIDPWLNGYDDNDPSSYRWPMDVIEKQFDELVARKTNIIKHKMTSVEGAKLFQDNYFDFIYIDGLHTYEGVITDINAWKNKLKKGMYIGGHDYGHKLCPGVKVAVDELLGQPEARFKEGSWLVRL